MLSDGHLVRQRALTRLIRRGRHSGRDGAIVGRLAAKSRRLRSSIRRMRPSTNLLLLHLRILVQRRVPGQLRRLRVEHIQSSMRAVVISEERFTVHGRVSRGRPTFGH